MTIGSSSRENTETHPDDYYWCRDYKGHRYSHDQALALIQNFHGHKAPGLVIGTKMVSLALERLPEAILFDAISETKSCLPDAVQMLTPCTINRNRHDGNSGTITLCAAGTLRI
ncbi:MAG: formylmethanofuran dehydrogenase subunit E family protein [Desulfamplus sp.]|nr:formylmethanofuran dehydrogenase subunit E family protein [Desulfamplus sp.]